MFIKQKSNILFRNYGSFGYITDNRNFAYQLTDDDKKDVGDKILSESGAVFFSVLSRKPQTLDNLARKIKKVFADVDIETIKKDAREFYCILEQDGFVVTGETMYECDKKDTKFSYKIVGPEAIKKDDDSSSVQLKKSTQEFFEECFRGKPQLTNLHIEITSRCNEKCVHCYIPHDKKVSDIEPVLFFDVLKQCINLKVLHITISGGEPMLHRHFCNFIKKCREYNFSVNILSNLTLLNDEIVKEMKKNPLLGVQVSLYSMNPKIHDGITQIKGSLEKTKNAILKLIDNNIPLQISCPIMKQNKNCYDEVIDWARKHKIRVSDDYVIIARYDHTTQNLDNRLSIKEVEEVIDNKIVNDIRYLEDIEKEADKRKYKTSDDNVCSVCHSSICIADNGNVYPCAGWQDYCIGNVKDTFLEDIWNNSEKIQYLRSLRRKDFPKCIQCPDKEFCTMCLVRNANEDLLGDPLVVNEYFCKIAKLNKEVILKWKNKGYANQYSVKGRYD